MASATNKVCPSCGTVTAADTLACLECGASTVAHPGGTLSGTTQPGQLDQEIGQDIGQFRIEAVLGGGGFAMVYRAWDTQLRRRVAVKLLHPHLARDTTFVNEQAR